MSISDQVNKAKFLKALLPDLYTLAWWLYGKFNGDIPSAKREINRIPDYWEDWEDEKQRVRSEIEELKKQGK